MVVHSSASSSLPSPSVSAHPGMAMNWQPADWAQESMVHGSPSLQVSGVPLQVPLKQPSLVVHGLLSLQEPVLLVWRHPPMSVQVSSVQTLWSSQFGAVPTQTPSEQ